MKRSMKYIAAVAVSVTAVSCSDFLDMTPRDSVSDKVIWESTKNAEMAVNYLYSYTSVSYTHLTLPTSLEV